MTDRLSGIREFATVAEAGSFAAAAARLNLSRSAVGKAVAKLEARLGVRLCHRTTRVLTLTEDGQAFYERCTRVLRELEQAELALESGLTEAVGKVRVTVPVVFGRHCIAPVLYDVMRKCPRLVVEIAFTDRPVDLIEEGYDLAVRNGTLPHDPGLMTRTIARQRMTVCASPAYLQRHGRPTTLADLPSHQAIDYANPRYTRTWLFPDSQGKNVQVVMNGRLRLDDLEAISDAAAAGLGLAWLPCWLIRSRVAKGELVRLFDELPATEFNSSALWPQTPFTPLRLRVLIDALAAQVPSMMG
ncbi:LysR family transcriptional regulator [Chelativorans xinjiangense]|uniref:LysR family transcriptional regulator n=1 Tax=Chelativorans xinjiangense TaxID=2681485 RepID=UPI001358FAC9|nr:LysR family transcriptional regulator [Chelativorans xinjiangense]